MMNARRWSRRFFRQCVPGKTMISVRCRTWCLQSACCTRRGLRIVLVVWLMCAYVTYSLMQYLAEHTRGHHKPKTMDREFFYVPTNSTTPLRQCTQQERLHQVRKTCERYDAAHTAERMTPYGGSIVDFKHQIIMCAIAKSGSTTLKSLIYEASGFNIQSRLRLHNLGAIHGFEMAKKFGLDWVKNLNQTSVKSLLSKYFTFMTIRHPFERLLSTYRGKVVDNQTDMRYLEKESLKLANRTTGKTTLNEFLTWIKVSGSYDEHWAMIIDACHPCAHDWGAIMRLETIDQDGLLLLNRLKPDIPYDAIPIRHSHQKKPVRNHQVMSLPEFGDVSDDVMKYFLGLYGVDMEMFGYRWDSATSTAWCAIQTEQGLCC